MPQIGAGITVDGILLGAKFLSRRRKKGDNMFRQVGGVPLTRYPSRGCSWRRSAGWFASVDAPFQARENVGIVAARGRMLSSVRPLMRQEDSRRPVWEFADWVQITHSVLEAQWKPLVVPAPSRRLLRHTLLPLALTSSRSWSAYAAAVGVL